MSEPRYYLLEHAGWRHFVTGGQGRPNVEVMILDRYYSHRVIWSQFSGGRSHHRIETIRRTARHLCDRMNADEVEAAA